MIDLEQEKELVAQLASRVLPHVNGWIREYGTEFVGLVFLGMSINLIENATTKNHALAVVDDVVAQIRLEPNDALH